MALKYRIGLLAASLIVLPGAFALAQSNTTPGAPAAAPAYRGAAGASAPRGSVITETFGQQPWQPGDRRQADVVALGQLLDRNLALGLWRASVACWGVSGGYCP